MFSRQNLRVAMWQERLRIWEIGLAVGSTSWHSPSNVVMMQGAEGIDMVDLPKFLSLQKFKYPPPH